jgi:hypothetical protein
MADEIRAWPPRDHYWPSRPSARREVAIPAILRDWRARQQRIYQQLSSIDAHLLR